jgi:hypothetical protein
MRRMEAVFLVAACWMGWLMTATPAAAGHQVFVSHGFSSPGRVFVVPRRQVVVARPVFVRRFHERHFHERRIIVTQPFIAAAPVFVQSNGVFFVVR